ncbi:undecaprenyl-phosphate glucose phosphotransferase [Robbsia sp. KACC 23696]|uniref:undecaprenyl-phosphate glucose phosphotransferase n=1 Tax=Robbsia sp. KACC 23696 TaxID=3149231 RepID=UPI00325AD5F1
MHPQSIHHHRLFMALVGFVSAAINTGVFVALMSFGGQAGDTPYARALTGALAVASFVIFARFYLVASARNLRWMLGRGAMHWCRLAIVLMVLLFVTHRNGGDMRVLLAQWAVLALPLQLLGLAILRAAAHSINNAPGNQRQAVFFGLGSEARTLSLRLHRSPILGIKVAGYYNDAPVEAAANEVLPPYLGRYEDAVGRIQANDFEIVFVGMGQVRGDDFTNDILNRLYDSTASIYLVPELRVIEDRAINGTDLAGIPLFAVHDVPILGLSRVAKRIVDVAGAAVMLLLLSPVMLACAIAVRVNSPGPILFRQIRYGERGETIYVHKFRSMYVTMPVDEEKSDIGLRQAYVGDRRITPVGGFLRRTSLDELPQFFDVLAGGMSLVGPRPHAAEHNEVYRRMIPGYMLRHSVKPGITGWAQINGLRGLTDTPDKMLRRVEFDHYYIKNWSLWLDIQILIKTIPSIIMGRNAI